MPRLKSAVWCRNRAKPDTANSGRTLEMSRLSHAEVHMVHRIGWLRAAVLGANDGLVSTASLVVGVAAQVRPSFKASRASQDRGA